MTVQLKSGSVPPGLCADPSFRTIPSSVLIGSVVGFLILSIIATKVVLFSPIAADLNRLLGPGAGIFRLFVQIALYLLPVIVCLVVGKIQHPFSALGLGTSTAGKGLLIGAAVSLFFLLKNIFTPQSYTISDDILILLVPNILLGTIFYEIFYRGFLMPAVGARLGFWPALFIVAALTAITQAFSYVFIPDYDALALARLLIETFVFSLIFGCVRCQTNSLWASILPHWVNGFAVFMRIF